MFKSKTKLISVRVSEEELWTFRQVCAAEGFASISDLTRTAMQEFVANRSTSAPSAFEREINRLNALVDKLDRDLKEIVPPVAAPSAK